VTPYQQRLFDTLNDIKRAIADDDKQHLAILFDRIEKEIINRR